MLYWKNKPIDELSNNELRTALSESVKLMLDKDELAAKDNSVSAFVVGSFAGMLIAGAVIAASLTF